jgi:hypothetical protein
MLHDVTSTVMARITWLLVINQHQSNGALVQVPIDSLFCFSCVTNIFSGDVCHKCSGNTICLACRQKGGGNKLMTLH